MLHQSNHTCCLGWKGGAPYAFGQQIPCTWPGHGSTPAGARHEVSVAGVLFLWLMVLQSRKSVENRDEGGIHNLLKMATYLWRLEPYCYRQTQQVGEADSS